MRGWVGICAIAFLLVGCESAEDKCDAARDEMRSGLRDATEAAVTEARTAEEARRAAMTALSSAVMDLGNIRSDRVVEAIGAGDDGAIGVEVSIGAMMAALLATENLADDDTETADALAAAARTELEGRYRELMTLDVAGDGANERLAELGDGCSTDLQTLVRDLPAQTRNGVLARFTALQADEEEPDDSTDYARVTTAFDAYQEARAAATAAKTRSAAIVAALDALDGSVDAARAAFEAIPADVDVGGASAAAPQAWEACAAAAE